jgi:glycerophosphoryl diester phosphodiesterase
MTILDYFSPTGIHVFAHRGFCANGVQENTIEAFKAALDAGATHIETDVQATSDGVAVVFHDDDLERIAGIKTDISELTLANLRSLNAQTAKIPTLREALEQLNAARFNIDIKRANAIAPTVEQVIAANAGSRVLISSFSENRRSKALSQLAAAGIRVATSAGMARTLGLYLVARLGWFSAFRSLGKDIDALQLPFDHKALKLQHPRLLKFASAAGIAVHYWVVNDAEKMRQLVAIGASGIVTDRADVAVRELRH